MKVQNSRTQSSGDYEDPRNVFATHTSSTLESIAMEATPNGEDGIWEGVNHDDSTTTMDESQKRRRLCFGLLLLCLLAVAFLGGLSLIQGGFPAKASTRNGDLCSEGNIKMTDSTTTTTDGSGGLISGPLVGHTTHDSVKLWAHYQQGDDAAETLQLIYHRVEDVNNVTGLAMITRSVDMAPNAANGASILVIDSLESNTPYQYELRIENERVASGRFKTAPSVGDPVEFNYLLASCMNVKKSGGYPDQPVWDAIRNIREPDFALLPGDTVYLTGDDWSFTGKVQFDRVWARNVEQRDESHFADFIANIPTYSTWDDHDYGMNNAGHDQRGKENSLCAFENLWANPSYGTEDVDGVFYSYMWGDVQFFVMDNRYYRDQETESQFGTAQKKWLFEQLKASTATFKIVVSASDVMERGMSQDVKDIGVVVTEHKISGVLFNAGDIHRNEFKARSVESWPYKVSQITSSGIARVWRRPFALINVNTQLEDPEVVASFYGADSKSLGDDATWSNDPDLPCSEVEKGDRYSEHRCTEVLRLSDLTAD